MMEGGANEVGEDVIVEAINFGLEAMRPVIDLQDRMRQEAGKAKRVVEIPAVDEALVAKVSDAALPGLKEGYGMARKMERYAKLDQVRKNAVQTLTAENPSLKPKVLEIIESLERRILREMILTENRRIDGRSTYGNPSDQLRGRAPAPRPRFGPLQPGRDAGPGDRDPGDLP